MSMLSIMHLNWQRLAILKVYKRGKAGEGSPLRAGTSLLLLAILTSCDDVRWEADCLASQQLYRTALAAMCVHWGEEREGALADLVEAAQNPNFSESVTTDTILDYTGNIGPEDCVEAGYTDPGPKLPDPSRERNREWMREIPPPRPPSDEAIASMRAKMANARRCNLEAKN